MGELQQLCCPVQLLASIVCIECIELGRVNVLVERANEQAFLLGVELTYVELVLQWYRWCSEG